MSNENIKTKKRRRKKKSAVYLVTVAVIMTAAVAVAMSMFFLVSEVSVTGNEYYTAEEIITASEIDSGKSIFFVDGDETKKIILDKLPYVDDILVEKELPGNVYITVIESYPIAWVRAEASCWFVDKNGKLLERIDTAPTSSNVIELKNITPLQPREGDIVAVSQDEEAKFDALKKILDVVFEMDLQRRISKIDFERTTNISFEFDGKFTVYLGRADDVADKFMLLKGVAEELGPDERGTIDLSQNGKAHFLPE